MRANKLTGLTMLAIAAASMWFAFETRNDANRILIEPVSVVQTR